MKNSTHSWDGVFGHGEQGMGKKLPMPYARSGCPSPPTLGMEFPAAFNEFHEN
ncbi:MAG: hypothetical protein V7K67_05105 [Nostoc sp.]|uniref:hypothetical protein n=1 Tax=Nostoc sp. TaxID=1180 RepID=UPI002FF9EEB6